MKLLFLDIDGVLNTNRQRVVNGIDHIDDRMTRRLHSVVKRTGCELVLSSTWRCRWEDLEMVRQHLDRHDMHLFGTTPVSIFTRSPDRGEEILAFLSSVDGVEEFAVLDDIPIGFVGVPEFDGKFVMTQDWGKDGGLQPHHVHTLVRHLGEKE